MILFIIAAFLGQFPGSVEVTWLFPLSGGSTLARVLNEILNIKEDLHRFKRDSVGMQDFALRYGGAKPIYSMTTPTEKGRNDPIVALDDSLRPGKCWRFDGAAGQIGVMLSHRVAISNVTVDHVPKELVTNVQNAPQNMILWGVSKTKLTISGPWGIPLPLYGVSNSGKGRSPALHGGHDGVFVLLASFRYDSQAADNIQTFPLEEKVRGQVYEQVILEVLDNWGAEFTCLYRVHIHGEPVA